MYLKQFEVKLRQLIQDYRFWLKRKATLEEIANTLEPYNKHVSVIEKEFVRIESSIYHLEKRQAEFQRQVTGETKSSMSIDEMWDIEDELEIRKSEAKEWKTKNRDAFEFYLNTYRELRVKRAQILPEYESVQRRLESQLAFCDFFLEITYSNNSSRETKILVPFTIYGCEVHLRDSRYLSSVSKLGGLLLAQPTGKVINDQELGMIEIHSVELPELELLEKILDSNMWFESFNFSPSDSEDTKGRKYVLDHRYNPHFGDSMPIYKHGSDPARHRKGG